MWWATRQDAPELPTSASGLGWVALSVAIYGLAVATRAERWRVLLRDDGAQPTRGDCYALTAVGFMGNNVLPARAGDAMRVLLLAPRAATDRRSVLGTLVAERVCDVALLFGLFAFLAVTVIDDAAFPEGSRLVFAAVGLVVLAAAAAIGALLLHRRGRLKRALEFLAPMGRATARLRQGGHLAVVGAWTVAVWASEIGVWWTAAKAADLGIDLIEAAYLLSLCSIFVLVPAGPGYAGTLDAGVALGARSLDKAGSAVVAYLVVLRFVIMLPVTVAGLVLMVTRYGGLGRLRAATAS